MNTLLCTIIPAACQTCDGYGNCLTCWSGSVVSGSTCVVSGGSSSSGSPSDPECSNYVAPSCLACYGGYYLNANSGVCTIIPALCQTCDNYGNCLSCWPGFSLSSGTCIVPTSGGNASPTDPECSNYVAPNCLSCYGGWYLDINGVCQLANPLCATVDTFDNCLTCYPGYVLIAGNCLVANPLCLTVDANNNCLTCYPGFTVSNGACVGSTANPLCATTDSNGNCLSCYIGYVLINSNCDLQNPNCNTVDGNNDCTSCYPGYYLDTGVCYVIDPLCQTFNQATL